MLKLNPARANEVLAAFGAKVPSPTPTTRRSGVPPAPIPSGTVVVLYNGSGRDGLIGQVQGDLQRAGVQASSGGNGSAAATTQIRYRSGNDAAAKAVQAYVSGDAELLPDRTVKNGEVVVLLGKSFTGVVDPSSPGSATTTTTNVPSAAPTTLPPKGSDPSVAC